MPLARTCKISILNTTLAKTYKKLEDLTSFSVKLARSSYKKTIARTNLSTISHSLIRF